jgi:hypothetical protein
MTSIIPFVQTIYDIDNLMIPLTEDKLVIHKMILNMCESVSCLSCCSFNSMYEIIQSKCEDSIKPLLINIINESFGNYMYLSTIKINNAYKKLINCEKFESYNDVVSQYGDHIADGIVSLLASRLCYITKNLSDHIVPAVVILLRTNEIDIRYALSLNIPTYELDEFLPDEDRKGANVELIQKIYDNSTILNNNAIDICTICQIDFVETENDSIILKIPCNHVFHWSCIKQALIVNASCPNCKENFKEKYYDKLTEDLSQFGCNDIDNLTLAVIFEENQNDVNSNIPFIDIYNLHDDNQFIEPIQVEIVNHEYMVQLGNGQNIIDMPMDDVSSDISIDLDFDN